MTESLLQKNKECFLTHKTVNLHKHEIYGASAREYCRANGIWVWVNADAHNMSNEGVHADRQEMIALKKHGQRALMIEHDWSIERFRLMAGMNYLEDYELDHVYMLKECYEMYKVGISNDV